MKPQISRKKMYSDSASFFYIGKMKLVSIFCETEFEKSDAVKVELYLQN